MPTDSLVWESRPWGEYATVYSSEETTVKLLRIFPGQALSLQYHEYREEFWTLTNPPTGAVVFIINGSAVPARMGVRYHIPRLVVHRIANKSDTIVQVLEVMRGRYDENDIVRIYDKYGRA